MDSFDFGLPPPEPSRETGTVDASEAIRYLSQRCNQGRVALLVGAGASASAGLPLWSAIGEELRKLLGKDNEDITDITALASMFVEEVSKRVHNPKAAKKRLVDLIQNILYAKRGHRDFGKIYPRLANLPVANFYTTNWDQLLVECLIQASVLRVDSFDNETISFSPAPAIGHSRHVVYLHGTIPGRLDQIIVTGEDYFEFEKLAHQVFERLVQQLKFDSTLLCIGYSFGDLDVLNYLQKALTQGDAGSNIYALLPPLSRGDAYTFWKRHRVFPITLGQPGCDIEEWVCAFLDALLGAIGGSVEELNLASLPACPPPGGVEVESLISSIKSRWSVEGLRSPLQWFRQWPGIEALRPTLPPTHPLLATAFVEREIKTAILERLRTGKSAGISGLLGIGGVGKSFLAMKIAHELVEEGWDVVWIGLLNQGTLEALELLAESYGLWFVNDLEATEKIAALRYLFEQVAARRQRTLVVLDNAEKFPNLPLIFEALLPVPVLVTSRTQECRDFIQYYRLESMDPRETAELCKLYLNTYDDRRFDRLTAEDQYDLRQLCDEHLGGHPLGIRLVLAGFVRRQDLARAKERPFREILREISEQGLSAIPEMREPASGRAGEPLHRTLFTTFEWLFRELPEIDPQAGREAQFVLPLLAALGTDRVSRSAALQVLKQLRTLVSLEQVSFRPSAALQDRDSSAQESSLESFGSSDVETIENAGLLASSLNPYPATDLIVQPPLPIPPSSDDRVDDSPPTWLRLIDRLEDEAVMRQATGSLISVALVDLVEDGETLRIHPLIREFAFAERALAGQEDFENLQSRLEGPSLEMILRSALSFFPLSPEYGDAILDLLSRIQGKKLTQAACSKILEAQELLGIKLGAWQLNRDLLQKCLLLARREGLEFEEGKILCRLGEVLDRMEAPEGLEMIEAGLGILERQPNPWSLSSYRWPRVYLNTIHGEKDTYRCAREAHELLRTILSQEKSLELNDSVMSLAEVRLKDWIDEGLEVMQLGLSSSGDNFLSNCILDLDNWLAIESAQGITPSTLDEVENLYRLANSRAEADSSSSVSIAPERHPNLQLRILVASDLLNPQPEEVLHQLFEGVLEVARKAGIRGVSARLQFGRHLWRRAVLAQDWRGALSSADQNLQLARQHPSVYAPFEMTVWEALHLASLVAVGPSDAAGAASLANHLESLGERVRRGGRDDISGWLLIARALLDASPLRLNVHSAARALVQAERAFERQDGRVPVEALALCALAVSRIDSHPSSLSFSALRGSLAPQDCVPPSYRPWLLRRRDELPVRVVSKVDGKPMRLVRGGLQGGPQGREVWMYSFYIDEEPVSEAEFRAISGLQQTTERSQVAAAGMSLETAAAYAKKTRKRLPNGFEWYAAKWQVAAGYEPEHWRDWATVRRQMLARIKSGIRGETWEAQPLLPGQDRARPTNVTEGWLRDRLIYLSQGRWLGEHPVIETAFLRFIADLSADLPEPLQEAISEVANASLHLLANNIQRLSASLHLPAEEKSALFQQLIAESSESVSYEEALRAKERLLRWLLEDRTTVKISHVETLMNGGWLAGSGLEEAFGRKWIAAFTSNKVGFSAAQAREIAFSLAGSISLSLDEKLRILQAVTSMSLQQLEQLLAILREEQKKFLALSPKHTDQLLTQYRKYNQDVVGSLIEGLPGFHIVRSISALRAVWSGAGSPENPLVLLGDPLTDPLWPPNVLLPATDVARQEIGIRCVLPIFMADDLDAVDIASESN